MATELWPALGRVGDSDLGCGMWPHLVQAHQPGVSLRSVLMLKVTPIVLGRFFLCPHSLHVMQRAVRMGAVTPKPSTNKIEMFGVETST